MTASTPNPTTWEELAPLLPPEIAAAPRTAGDTAWLKNPDVQKTRQGRTRTNAEASPAPQYPLSAQTVRYLAEHVLPKPWGNHLALLVAIQVGNNLRQSTIYRDLTRIHCRLQDWHDAKRLTAITGEQIKRAMVEYLSGLLFPEHTPTQRSEFWQRYQGGTNTMENWLQQFAPEVQENYRQWLLPRVDPMMVEGLVEITPLRFDQYEHRKRVTTAVVSRFAELRYAAYMRFTSVKRLYEEYQKFLELTKDLTSADLPVAFTYEDMSDHVRYHFRLWDRRSFTLHEAHDYSPSARRHARTDTHGYEDDQNNRFVELVLVESLAEGVREDDVQEFWFLDLYHRGVMEQALAKAKGGEHEWLATWLETWGYYTFDARARGETTPHGKYVKHELAMISKEQLDTMVSKPLQRIQRPLPSPFSTASEGLLNWGRNAAAKYMSHAQGCTDGLLLPLESIYAACVFGILALNLFTTTRMQVNEAMQIRQSNDCFFIIQRPAAPEAKNQWPRQRYGFRLISKGERRDVPADYFIDRETYRLVDQTCRLLQQHYGLEEEQTLPKVPFTTMSSQRHRFGEGHYLFQYQHTHLHREAISACMRFLMHGLTFQDEQGKLVILVGACP